ncbi:MAG: hypothetical protein GXY05_04650 [Clostridiales bacterium]|nr:hypothetical protein [Clostridiales bacterium]
MLSGSFEGWYFKQQSNGGVIAFIPAVHTGRDGEKSGSLQIVTRDKAWCVVLPDAPVYTLKPALSVSTGGCTFSSEGIKLDIRQPDISVTGQLCFGLPTLPKGDIMGLFKYVPFMECRHSVFSMTHTLSGSLTVNDSCMDFADGMGYIEGDRGRSFPKRYIWTQCSWEDESRTDMLQHGTGGMKSGLCSVMLSVADVRPLGIPFIGIIGFVYYCGTEHRIATYCGAKIDKLSSGRVTVRQGDMKLTAQLLDWNAKPAFKAQKLQAPVSGRMERLIKENLACRARYTFTVKECVLFDFITDKASFEYEF